MVSQAYEALNRSWKSTCRVLLGDEVGELEDYEGWLSEHRVPMLRKKSSVSQKDVYCAITDYPEEARFVSLDEVDYDRKFQPLGINEIKDIDSIVEAIGERFQYCGNVVLGNSKNVDHSSDVQNSFYVLGSNFVYDSEYVAYSSYCRGSKHLFAVVSDYNCDHLIRVFETHKQSRCLEAWKCYNSSDCYFSCSMEGSQDAMFSFNQQNKRNIIGNIELPRDEYLRLKHKLISEIREDLIRNKRLPSLMDIVSSSAKPPELPKRIVSEVLDEDGDKAPIEEAFQKTTNVVLGKTLHGFESYGGWIKQHIPSVDERRSAATGKRMHVAGVTPCSLFPHDRLVDRDEYWQIGEITRLDGPDIESFNEIKRSVGKIAFVNPNGRLGECRNLMLVPLCNTSVNVYCCPIASFNEGVAFSYWPRDSKYMFGSALAFSSNFCINSYYSMNLSRAFEVDGCNNCSDAYFAHNCENVKDSLFCFNAKNLRFAIGNSQMQQDEYKKAKTLLLGQIADELESKKELKWSIYNVGCGKG